MQTIASLTQTHADWVKDGYGVRFKCAEGEHNDLATLFLEPSHDTIIQLFGMGHNPGQAFTAHFTKAGLAVYMAVFLVLMSIGEWRFGVGAWSGGSEWV